MIYPPATASASETLLISRATIEIARRVNVCRLRGVCYLSVMDMYGFQGNIFVRIAKTYSSVDLSIGSHLSFG